MEKLIYMSFTYILRLKTQNFSSHLIGEEMHIKIMIVNRIADQVTLFYLSVLLCYLFSLSWVSSFLFWGGVGCAILMISAVVPEFIFDQCYPIRGMLGTRYEYKCGLLDCIYVIPMGYTWYDNLDCSSVNSQRLFFRVKYIYIHNEYKFKIMLKKV